jgi:hypothetical protein
VSSKLSQNDLKIQALKSMRERESCAYSIAMTIQVSINLQGNLITSCKAMEIIGAMFDRKILWGPQIAQAIVKASRALHATQVIKG